jgi:hypothetical protein
MHEYEYLNMATVIKKINGDDDDDDNNATNINVSRKYILWITLSCSYQSFIAVSSSTFFPSKICL